MNNNSFVIEQHNEHYQRALLQEMRVWKRTALAKSFPKENDSLNKLKDDNKQIHKYYNSIFSIDSDSEWGWIDYIEENMGEYDSALSLGSGSGRVEDQFIKRNIVESFETIDIIDKSDNISEIDESDLNFIILPENRYDLILCKGVLHHIINLEHLLYQINRSLKSGGILIVKEYIGDVKGLLSSKRLDYINKKLETEFGRKRLEDITMKRIPQPNSSPFAAARSLEIPKLTKYYFGENILFEFRYGGITYPVIGTLNMISRYHPVWLHNKDEIIEEIIEYSIKLEKEIIDSGIVEPTLLFGAYKKSTLKKIPKVTKWSDKLIDFHFTNRLPLYRKFHNKISDLYNEFFSI